MALFITSGIFSPVDGTVDISLTIVAGFLMIVAFQFFAYRGVRKFSENSQKIRKNS